MRVLRPAPSLVTPKPSAKTEKTLDARRAPAADGFETKRTPGSTGKNDAFVPVPKSKPSSVAPQSDPIVIPNIVGDAVAGLHEAGEAPLNGPEDKTVYPAQPDTETEAEAGIEREEAAEGEVGGAKVGAKIVEGAKVVLKDEVKDGVRVATVTTEVTHGVDADAKKGGVGVKVKAGGKDTVTREVRVPADKVKPRGSTDPYDPRPEIKDITPNDPASMPVGTVIREDTKATEEVGGGVGVNVEGIGAGADYKHSESTGTTTVTEKTGPDTVKVTKGPTSATNDSGGFDVTLLGIGVSVGGTRSTEEQHLETATFDLSTKEGREAYDEYLRTGELPKANAPGVSDVASIDKTGKETSRDFKLKLFGIDLGAIDENSRNVTVDRKTSGDGSVEEDIRIEAQTNGAEGAVVIHRAYAPDGSEKLDERTIDVEVTVDEGNIDAINDEMRREGRPLVKLGDTATIPANEDTLELFRKLPQRASLLRALAEAGAMGPEVQALSKEFPDADCELLNHAVNELGMSVTEVQNGMLSPKFRQVMEDIGPYFEEDKARLEYIQREAARRGVPIRIAAQEIADLYAINREHPNG